MAARSGDDRRDAVGCRQDRAGARSRWHRQRVGAATAALGMGPGHTPQLARRPGIRRSGWSSDERNELAARADFNATLLLMDETRGVLDADFFAAAKRGAHFIVGRGKTVVTSALVAALESGQLLVQRDNRPGTAACRTPAVANAECHHHRTSPAMRNFFRHALLAKENLRRFRPRSAAQRGRTRARY